MKKQRKRLAGKGLPCAAHEADCSGNASSPNPTKQTIHFLHSHSFYGAMIHSDGVREQVFAPRFSIKSQALEEEMKNNFPIFGDNQFGKMADSLSLRGTLRFSLIVVITHLKANASLLRVPFTLPEHSFTIEHLCVTLKAFAKHSIMVIYCSLWKPCAPPQPCPLNFRKHLLFPPGTNLLKDPLEIFCWGMFNLN